MPLACGIVMVGVYVILCGTSATGASAGLLNHLQLPVVLLPLSFVRWQRSHHVLQILQDEFAGHLVLFEH